MYFQQIFLSYSKKKCTKDHAVSLWGLETGFAIIVMLNSRTIRKSGLQAILFGQTVYKFI